MAPLAILLLATICLSLSLGAASASASKQAIAYFGSETGTGTLGGEFSGPADIAVNSSDAGPAGKGEIYVLDISASSSRIQRFAQNDNGTPADPYDDKYEFVSAWGTDVVAPGGSGDRGNAAAADYEICTVAAECQAGVISGGNGTPAGNGSLALTLGIAVDQDTGDVYVSDAGNSRVDVYAGDGTFLRSFGWDVVESGPDNSGTGYEICIAANGDVCKAGVPGTGVGQLGNSETVGLVAVSSADGNPATGTVFVSNPPRLNTYNLDGSSPSALPNFVRAAPIAVDSRGIIYSVGGNASGSVVTRYDSQNADGGGVGPLAPIEAPPLAVSAGTNNRQISGLKVDSDSDGPGPEKDTLYVLRNLGPEPDTVVQQFGPVNAPGLATPPAAEDDEHGALIGFNFVTSLGFDESSGRLFVGDPHNVGGKSDFNAGRKSGVYVLDTAGGPPSASLDSLSDPTSTGVTVHATVEPNGPPNVSYHLEYSLDGSKWAPTPEVVVGSQEAPQSITTMLEPPTGLEPNTLYHVRLVATKVFTPSVVTSEATFTTLASPPGAETTGSPVRSATTASLEGRVNPRNSAAAYHFEYGSEGPCDANPCTATEPHAAGSGDVLEPVSQAVEGLQPGTTYHYRVVADNGNPGSPGFGADMTLTTRASDAPLGHGHLPGPPGSDRAWEQVNLPDTGGNPVVGALALSDDGERAMYQIAGGTPISTTGSLLSQYFAQRTATGWQTQAISPLRDQLSGQQWLAPAAPSDLSSLFAPNGNFNNNAYSFWRLAPGAAADKLFGLAPPATEFGFFYAAAADAPTSVAVLKGAGLDPAYPGAAAVMNLYELGSGAPRLLSILPDGSPPSCGVGVGGPGYDLSLNYGRFASHWVSADGSLVFFPSHGDGCADPSLLYARDLGAGTTRLISGPALSGPLCGGAFIKSTPGAVFFWTQARLAPEDRVPGSCNANGGGSDGDVYRYDLGDDSFKCVTCVVSGLPADVFMAGSPAGVGRDIAVAEDGSRVYFQSPGRLLAGAPSGSLQERNTYRVDVQTGALRWIGGPGIEIGDMAREGSAVSRDGSTIVFSSSDPSLNPLGGSDNGGTRQYYRYDDRDRSLVCVSCSQDGSAPTDDVQIALLSAVAGEQVGPNLTPLSDDGTFLFATTTALVAADQNTPGPGWDPGAGTDIYEWRDGRVLLLTDGLTEWPGENAAPKVGPISPSGRDAFFVAAAQYTPDALDASQRLYDARIGGGFEFPPPPKPCPLEVCQGTPRGAPEEAAPGTASFAGPGNPPPPRRHRKKRKHAHHNRAHHNRAHHNRAHHNRAHHNRRTAR